MIAKGRYVSELGDGDRVKAVFMLSERRLLTARTGKQYAKMIFVDRTGQVPGILWDDVQQQLDGVEPGAVVGVRGSMESFNGLLQLRAERVIRIQETDVDMGDLIPTTKLGVDGMMEQMEALLGSIDDVYLKRLVDAVLAREGMREAFCRAPAAKGVHHNYIGGLLEHTVHILKSIDVLLPVYAHLGLNRDMLLTGAFLHDIGKIDEYTPGHVIEMTSMGRLVGHIYLSAHLADEEIARIDGFPEELRLQLIHLIISHHGELEYGSPKVTMTREAMFLHSLDDLDAKLIGFSSIIEATPEEDDFSSFSRVYNRYLYTKRYESPGVDGEE